MNNYAESQCTLEESEPTAAPSAPYLAALNAASTAILIVDANETVLYANPAARMFATILNPHGAESELRHARDWHPQLLPAAALQRGLLRNEWTIEAPSTATGQPIALLVEVSALGPERSGPYMLSMRDVTRDQAREAELHARNAELEVAYAKLEGAQAQIVQSERLASIGQLAAGVAHEINNPIGFVSSNLNTLQRYVANLLNATREYAAAAARSGGAEGAAEIEEIRSRLDLDFLATDIPQLLAESCEGIDRVSKIIRDLKDFSRRERSEDWTQADLHKGIDATLNIVWNELKYKAEVVKSFGELPLVECLPSELNQVFMNVLVNAGQAIQKNGLITISTGREGDNVWVAIGDNGEGIPADVLPRIFDPFFTTKPVGTGTGLGLAISYGIVAKHHGNIQITSFPGEGTLLRIELPIKQPH